jgi:hypothetical protein
MVDSYEWMSRLFLSWHSCGSCRSLIEVFCNWLLYVSRKLTVILVVVQWSSPSCRSLMFLSFSSVLSFHDLNAPSFLESIFSWSVFSCVWSTRSPLLICGWYMDRSTVSLESSGLLLFGST